MSKVCETKHVSSHVYSLDGIEWLWYYGEVLKATLGAYPTGGLFIPRSVEGFYSRH